MPTFHRFEPASDGQNAYAVLELLGESLDRVRDRVRKLSLPALADVGVAMLRALREVRRRRPAMARFASCSVAAP